MKLSLWRAFRRGFGGMAPENFPLPAGFEGPQAPYVHAHGPQAPHPHRGSGKKCNMVTNLV
jgi:hypothetical protein